MLIVVLSRNGIRFPVLPWPSEDALGRLCCIKYVAGSASYTEYLGQNASLSGGERSIVTNEQYCADAFNFPTLRKRMRWVLSLGRIWCFPRFMWWRGGVNVCLNFLYCYVLALCHSVSHNLCKKVKKKYKHLSCKKWRKKNNLSRTCLCALPRVLWAAVFQCTSIYLFSCNVSQDK